ncbi:hypothetical protein KP509_28G006100 [Ceratopteris richardii]|nr:hypothetical protein KP509_28G006100 [Ceratopteris richardii]
MNVPDTAMTAQDSTPDVLEVPEDNTRRKNEETDGKPDIAGNVALEDALLDGHERPDGLLNVSDCSDDWKHVRRVHSDLSGVVNLGDLSDALMNNAHSSQRGVGKTGIWDAKFKLWQSMVGKTNSTSTSHKNVYSLASGSDVSKAVLDLVDAAQNLQKNPANIAIVNNLIDKLKDLLLLERQTYALMRQNSGSRKKIESMFNLIQFLESQVRRLENAVQRQGLSYYLASISSKIRGNEVGRIGRSMETELQSWLDQECVREVADIAIKGSDEEEAVRIITSFEKIVQKGYNPLIQDTILSVGLVEKIVGLLVPGAAPWKVTEAAALALSALLDFNKNIFVSLVLMAKMVENVLQLMDLESDDHVLTLISVMKNMLLVGETIVADEIYAKDGIPKIVELLDHDVQDLQLEAVECIFMLVYYGRVEVVNELFQLDVIKKLALLQQKNAEKRHLPASVMCEMTPAAGASYHLVLTKLQEDIDGTGLHPFADAVSKFILHLSVGTGLRRREKRALKQEFLRQIREVLEDDTEVADITAEVLWAP